MRGKLPVSGESDYGTRSLLAIRGGTIHYTASAPSLTAQQCAAYQTSESARAQTGAGVPFPGLAYTLYVEEDGRVILAHSLTVRVWHSAAVINGNGRNYTHVGIVYSGNREPNLAQREGLSNAIRWVEDQVGLDLPWEAHGDVYPTECCGPTSDIWIPTVVRVARA
jgi:hypothetical protein